MPQGYLGSMSSGGEMIAAQEVDAGCGLQGPLAQNRFQINLIGGETFSLRVCFCDEMFSIDEIVPGGNQLILKDRPCMEDGSCIKTWCHQNADCGISLNGVHVVNSSSKPNFSVTLDTDLSEFEAETFDSAPPVLAATCETEGAEPPMGCNLRDISDYQLMGRITNRIPGVRTRLAVVGRVVASDVIQLVEEAGQIQPGDTITVANGGVSNATVLRRWNENGHDWLRHDGSASVSPSLTKCYSITSEVGVIADMEYRIDGVCGCAEVYLESDVTNSLPQIGPAQTDDGSGRQVAPFFNLGVFSIFAQYLDADLRINRELIGQGTARYTPSTYAVI
jgi:hypothetical protein